MRNSAGFAPLQLPQFAWASIDQRRKRRTNDPDAADATPEPATPEARPEAVGNGGEENNS